MRQTTDVQDAGQIGTGGMRSQWKLETTLEVPETFTNDPIPHLTES